MLKKLCLSFRKSGQCQCQVFDIPNCSLKSEIIVSSSRQLPKIVSIKNKKQSLKNILKRFDKHKNNQGQQPKQLFQLLSEQRLKISYKDDPLFSCRTQIGKLSILSQFKSPEIQRIRHSTLFYPKKKLQFFYSDSTQIQAYKKDNIISNNCQKDEDTIQKAIFMKPPPSGQYNIKTSGSTLDSDQQKVKTELNHLFKSNKSKMSVKKQLPSSVRIHSLNARLIESKTGSQVSDESQVDFKFSPFNKSQNQRIFQEQI